MSEFAHGQHPNTKKNYFTKGHKIRQKSEQPLDRRVMIRLTQEQFTKLEAIAKTQGLAKADILRNLLDEVSPIPSEN